MKILFLSRAYPPVVGGIERQNFEISQALADIAEVTVLANRRGKIFIPLYVVVTLVRVLLVARRYDVILLGDGVLALPGWLLKVLTGKPVVCIVHGLDITFRNGLYQALWVRFALKRLDALFAVGNETIRQAVARGVDPGICNFVPNGVQPFAVTLTREQACAQLVLPADRKYLLTLGRLVRRAQGTR